MIRRALLRALLGSVAGGLPPQRPDQVTPSNPAGGAPGASQQVIRARLVLVSGPGSGVFLYSGPPGSGDLVESVTEASADPFGNAAVPGFGSYDHVFGGAAQLHGSLLKLFAGVNVVAQLGPGGYSSFNSHGAVLFSIDVSRAAQFLYADTGSAAQGALVASEASAAGTDQFGNAYVEGIANYVSVPGHGSFAVSLISAGALFYTAATPAGPWTQGAGVSIASGALAGLPAGSLVLASQNAGVVAAPGDGNIYPAGQLMSLLTANAAAVTAAATSTGLSVNVGNSFQYYFEAELFVLMSAVAADIELWMAGTAAVSAFHAWVEYDQVNVAAAGDAEHWTTPQTVLGTSGGTTGRATVAAMTYRCRISGFLTVTAAGAGTLVVEQRSATAGAWTVQLGSALKLYPLTA